MKRVFLFIAAVVALAACTKENVSRDSADGQMQTIKVNVASFDSENATKTAVTPAGKFTWTAGDQIGIYPLSVGEEQTSQQIIFKVKADSEASSSTFTGTGWGLITNGNYTYFSYYPYSTATTHGQATVTYADELNQVNNTSTAHLGVNDFLYAPAITPASVETASFNFYHVGALVEFEITVPSDSKSKTFTRVEVSCADSLFVKSGKYNPSTTVARNPESQVYGPEITDKVMTNTITLLLNGGSGFTPDSSTGIIHAYFLIAPAKVKGKTLNVSIWDSSNHRYAANKTLGIDIESQNHKVYQCSVVEKPDSDVWNLSEKGTANCYIVPEAGRFGFLANIKGNGYDPYDDENHNANAAIDLKGCTAEVLWETDNRTTGDDPTPGIIVSNVSISGNYIIFTASGTQGNAVIALKNAKNTIIWTWHIWATTAKLEPLAKVHQEGGSLIMDRNIGAISNDVTTKEGWGLLYQYGRTVPMNAGYRTTNSSMWYASANGDSLEIAISKPMCKYYNSTQSGWWCTDKDVYCIWGDSHTTDKTMYDPCPVGWRMPYKNTFMDIDALSFNTSTGYYEDNYSGEIYQKGWYGYFSYVYTYINLSYNATIFWVTMGMLGENYNSLMLMNMPASYSGYGMRGYCYVRPAKE